MIAACCDLRIGTAGTKFGFPIARTLGNCLSVRNLARLSALIGAQRVKELIFTARLMEAEEALRIGLLTEVVKDRAELDTRARHLRRRSRGYAPLTLRSTKEALRRLASERGAGPGPDLDVLHERGFPRRHERLSGKAKPQLAGEMSARSPSVELVLPRILTIREAIRTEGDRAMPQVPAPKRDATWDIARGIGMMLVIYGHLLEPMYPAHNGGPS